MDRIRQHGFQFLLWRGILGILAGIVLIFLPLESALVLSIFIGAWMIVDGFVTVGLAFDLKKVDSPWGWTLTEGILSVLAGIAIILIPGVFAVVSAFFILGFMAIGLVLTGVTQLSLPKDIRSGLSIAVGIINVLFGVLLGFLAIFNPVQNVWTLAWVAGIYMIILGTYALVLAFQVRRSTKD